MKTTLKIAMLVFVLVLAMAFDEPVGWAKRGSMPASYDMGIEKGTGINGSDAATIKSKKKKIDGFGTLLQACVADTFRGKRVRMSGYMRSEDVAGWAGFWLRVDKDSSGTITTLSFDNMYDRHVKGTTSWTKYEIVLDVPADASMLYYGALLNSTGQIWFDDINFNIVDESVPVTGNYKQKKPKPAPTNLDFEKK